MSQLMKGVRKKIQNEKFVNIAIVDDHKIFRDGLELLISGSKEVGTHKYFFDVQIQLENGKALVEYLKTHLEPHVLILDINMPEMDGFETAAWLQKNYPDIKIVVLTMFDKGEFVDQMLKLGVKGYITKNSDNDTLIQAIHAAVNDEIYVSDHLAKKVISSIYSPKKTPHSSMTKGVVSSREIEFLKLACTDMTYKDIAGKMFLSTRTIDGYRDTLFEKLKVKTRVGLVLHAIKNGLIPGLESLKDIKPEDSKSDSEGLSNALALGGM